MTFDLFFLIYIHLLSICRNFRSLLNFIQFPHLNNYYYVLNLRVFEKSRNFARKLSPLWIILHNFYSLFFTYCLFFIIYFFINY